MKAKTGFNLRDVYGEQVIVAEDRENIDFSNIISMNETSAYLWSVIQDKNSTVDDSVELLTREYDVDEQTARKDAQALTSQWPEAGICEQFIPSHLLTSNAMAIRQMSTPWRY